MPNAIDPVNRLSASSDPGDVACPSAVSVVPVVRGIHVGDSLNDGVLLEVQVLPDNLERIRVRARTIRPLLAGKTILVFGIAGAHGARADMRIDAYVRAYDKLRASGIDEIWCVAIQNPFVLGVWGLELVTEGRLRLMSDRDGSWTRAIGLVCSRFIVDGQAGALSYSFLVVDGVVSALCCDETGRRADAIVADLSAPPRCACAGGRIETAARPDGVCYV